MHRRPGQRLRNARLWVVALALLVAGVMTWQGATAIHERSVAKRIDRFMPEIESNARRTGLDVSLIRAVIREESGGRPDAVSNQEAYGLMQVRADAETDALRLLKIPRGDLFDPAYNILIGTTYLDHLDRRFDGNPYFVMAAYHMGPTRVQAILKDHPGLTGEQLIEHYSNPTTRAYVRKVLAKK
jgi:soluble lytic murein transglycosylase